MDENIFSERGYANRPCYNFYQFPNEFRGEVAALMEHAASSVIKEALLHFIDTSNGAKYARFDENSPATIAQFIGSAPSVYFLDLVENFIRLYRDSWPPAKTTERTKELANTINDLFDKYNIGYSIVGKIVVRRDSQYFDLKVVRKAYRLLFAAGFEGALASFEGALDALNADPPDHMTVMAHVEAALTLTFKELLKRYTDSGLWDGISVGEALERAATLPKFPREAVAAGRPVIFLLRATRQMIETMPGVEKVKPGDYTAPHACATFALNMTGAYIILLLQLNKDLIATGEMSEWDLFA